MTSFDVTPEAIRKTARGPIGSGAAAMAAASRIPPPQIETGRHFAELTTHLASAALGISGYLGDVAGSLEAMSTKLNLVAANYEATEAENTAAAQQFFRES